MVKLRLQRFCTHKKPFYRILAADARKTRDGRYLEIVGVYEPTKQPAFVEIDNELAKKWLHAGAQPTDTVRKFIKNKLGLSTNFYLKRIAREGIIMAVNFEKLVLDCVTPLVIHRKIYW
jgi:small subunit ribosomal protein S16